MKLNCDLGESFGSWSMGLDDEIMPFIDQANIACGFHAGDPVVMSYTLANAKKHQIEIGAHPSYPDLNGFGRRSMNLSADELRQCLHYQIAALEGMAQVQGLTLAYVKPHGALYNDMMINTQIRQVIMQAIKDYPTDLQLMLQSTLDHERHKKEAKQYNLSLIFEAFADRSYEDSGLLTSRQFDYAVHDENKMLHQVTQLVNDQTVTTHNGNVLSIPVDTLCVHGDNPTAVTHIKNIRDIVSQHEI